jgi:hypothetical protein
MIYSSVGFILFYFGFGFDIFVLVMFRCFGTCIVSFRISLHCLFSRVYLLYYYLKCTNSLVTFGDKLL